MCRIRAVTESATYNVSSRFLPLASLYLSNLGSIVHLHGLEQALVVH